MSRPVSSTLPAAWADARPRNRALSVAVAAAAVAVSAQVVVPNPVSPVPFTLQPLAVLIVGGLLGPRLGAAALVAYLAAGMAGLPVFAAGGSGVGRLLGPTGGYLLAFPVAAAVTGLIARRGSPASVLIASAAGMAVIHVGGSAQLAALTGDIATAFDFGFVPFFTGDMLKIGLAALVILGLRTRTGNR